MARPRQITDEQILDATRRAALVNGAQVSLDVVAQELGVTAPALLKRFGSRHELFLTALLPNEAALDAIFEAPAEDCELRVALESIIERLSGYFGEMLPRVMALRECGVSHEVIHERIKRPIPVRAVAGMTRWLEELKARGAIESPLIEAASTAIVGAVMTRMMASHLSKNPWPKKAQKTHQGELAQLFATALGARKTRRRRKSP